MRSVQPPLNFSGLEALLDMRKRRGGGGRAQAAPTFDGQVLIEGEDVIVVSPEGQRHTLPLASLWSLAVPPRPDSRGCIHPTGVKHYAPFPGGLVAVHQTAPRVWSFKWLDPSSAAEFGEGATYREVRLALPYLIVLAVYEGFGGPRQPVLSGWNECFFALAPLEQEGLATPLYFPALLNCSRFDDEDRPLSWICVQYLGKKPTVDLTHPAGLDRGLRTGLSALLQHLLETGFNRSSEHHELNSWFTETVKARVDPRLANVETWERASAEDPLFALDVKWLPVEKTLGQVIERIAKSRGNGQAGLCSAADVARLVTNHGKLEKEQP
jgi:hypothetical protein